MERKGKEKGSEAILDVLCPLTEGQRWEAWRHIGCPHVHSRWTKKGPGAILDVMSPLTDGQGSKERPQSHNGCPYVHSQIDREGRWTSWHYVFTHRETTLIPLPPVIKMRHCLWFFRFSHTPLNKRTPCPFIPCLSYLICRPLSPHWKVV
jgi:hypothetical protein